MRLCGIGQIKNKRKWKVANFACKLSSMRLLQFASYRFKAFFIALLAAVMFVPTTSCADEGIAKEKTIYLPQFQPVQSVMNETDMLYTIVGKLTLSEECLRIVYGEKSYLLIWPGWYIFDSVSRKIVVSNLRTGAVVAQFKIGDKLSLSGGELENRPFGLKYSIPEQCLGPYWAVGDIESTKSGMHPKKTYTTPNQEREKPITFPNKINFPRRGLKKTTRQPKKINDQIDPELERSIIK
jgi:hypothetical protein